MNLYTYLYIYIFLTTACNKRTAFAMSDILERFQLVICDCRQACNILSIEFVCRGYKEIPTLSNQFVSPSVLLLHRPI